MKVQIRVLDNADVGAEFSLRPNLCYTIALDEPGKDIHRRMARLLVTSLLRTGWHGRITVFRNSRQPVLPEALASVQEVVIDADVSRGWDETISWKYRARDWLDLSGMSKVLFLDCDCIVLRSINHLMMGAWDIYTAPEPGRIVEVWFNGFLTDAEMIALKERPGLNAGNIGVRAAYFTEVMAEWERIDQGPPLRPSKTRDQHAWNRFILDTPLRHRPFTRGEVQFPFLHRADFRTYRRAALVHVAGGSPEEKLSLMYGLWMATFGRGQFDDLVTPLPRAGQTPIQSQRMSG